MDAVEHTRLTREAYDRLAAVWSDAIDAGPFNGWLERPALRELVPRPLSGLSVLDAGCGSGAQSEWLLGEGAEVTGVDLSPAMVEQARRRCRGAGRFVEANLAEPLPFAPGAFHGVTCSLTLHYLRDWDVALTSFRRLLRPDGWVVLSVDHPFGEPLPGQALGYYGLELVSDTWTKADVQVTQRFWRRPLGAAVDEFAAAGFVIDRVVEPRPSAAALQRFPAELRQAAQRPVFIVYRLRLAQAPTAANHSP